MRRAHEMPFGARYGPEATRFRLWAPACRDVALVLGTDGRRVMPMNREGDGWFGLDVPGVRPGERYAFRVKEGAPDVPDPASRANPDDVNGPSRVVDPRAFPWDDDKWHGRPWNEAVVYELHVGTFTPGGTFASAVERLDHLASLGVTAVELMPVADFAGRRGWGYDGVLPFAPDAAYGTPEDLKRLVCECHRRGLMVLLDVVYNHFGPEGNYLPLYAPAFFNEARQTPWGAAINFDGPGHYHVREFFVHNALYWLEEFHLDGLRMDAIHAIADGSEVHIVREIAAAIEAGPALERHVHLILENDANDAGLLDPAAAHARAQWNDDAHHAFHVLLAGEREGYYADYAQRPAWMLGRTMAEGFAYQGEGSPHRGGEARGERSSHLPLTAFVAFLQNHDQVGNRAMGERLHALVREEAALRLGVAALLLSPSIPLLFMGEEFGAATPFLYFCDFHGELADAVREGRRREFASFPAFADPASRERIPDPNAESTFAASRLDWASLGRPGHARWLEHYRRLLALRALKLAPRLDDRAHASRFEVVGEQGLAVDWALADGARLAFHGNFGARPVGGFTPVPGAALMHAEAGATIDGPLPAWGGRWLLTAP